MLRAANKELVSLQSTSVPCDDGNGSFEIQADKTVIEEPSAAFPYHNTKRMVSFGGHPSWLNTIRTLLPDMRFYDRESIPNLMAVRNADVVWLQINALGHSFSERICNEARRCHTPVKYFEFASAAKCAVQVIEADLEEPV